MEKIEVYFGSEMRIRKLVFFNLGIHGITASPTRCFSEIHNSHYHLLVTESEFAEGMTFVTAQRLNEGGMENWVETELFNETTNFKFQDK
jgi:hypothetical protein